MAYENAARKVPFWPRAFARLSTRKSLLVAALACSAAIAAQPASKFLQLGEGERYWWYEGAFRSMSHLISTQDRQKGACVADWYLKDREAKRRLIEKAIAGSPEFGETTIIISLVEKTCGPLLSKAAR